VEFFEDEQERDAVPFLQLRVFSRQVQGLVCFGAVPSVIQVGKNVKRITLPLVVTAPVVAERLAITSSESLSDAVISVVSKGERDYLAIDVAGGLLEEGVEDCWVKIRDPDSGRGSEARFLLEATPMMSVSPKIVNFNPLKDTGNFQAKAFLLIDPKLISQQEEKDETDAVADVLPTVICRAGEQGVDVKLIQSRPGFYRMELELPELLAEDNSEFELEWDIEFNGAEYRLKSWGRFWK
jgi:hypothetical protein